MSYEELERKFPGSTALLKDATALDESSLFDRRQDPFSYSQAPMANLAGLTGGPAQYGRVGGARERANTPGGDGGCSVYEAWIRSTESWEDDGGETYVEDSWEVKVIAGNRVLMAAKAADLFGHGRHPYSRYVCTETGDFWGSALVEQLTPLQLSLNRLLAALHANAELTGMPVFLEDARSGIPRTKITNKPGQRITKNTGSTAEWMTPPSMPAQTFQLVEFYLNEMERISGLSAIVRGMTPKGRNAQGVLDSIQEAAFVRIRDALRNLEYCLMDAGQLLASLICENYTIPRIIAITGQEGEMGALGLTGRHFYAPQPDENGKLSESPLKFSLWIQAGSSFPTSRQARAAEADILLGLGAIDQEATLEAHDYPGRAQIIERMQQQKAGQQQTQQRRIRPRAVAAAQQSDQAQAAGGTV